MGLFQSRPEEPTEWAGLPAEPWDEPSPSERLTDPTEASPTAVDLDALRAPEGHAYLAVPIETVQFAAGTEAPEADGDGD
ncbi:hypothetical protein [Microbacterium sp.]|uniref:hypothetical protein n=1 Tax=Microbacterium sp. TaxID=51671 RepID=UPI0039E67817